ncbi:protein hairy [Hetaerina americana]|uniref:protein hairy n=1 Tax=Hetaerina americana TaxID=62018 RepID=UPI003A7F2E6D
MGASGSPGSAGVPTAVGGTPMVVVGGGVVAPAGVPGGPLVPNGAPVGNAAGSTVEVAAATTASAAVTGTTMPSAHRRSATDNRRSNKPIMEKRRRARINNCLNELKALILDATKKDPARHSKLEKADILEMTVRHLETLRRQRAALSAAADPTVLNKYKAGFSECAAEVSRFLMRHSADAADASSPSSSPSVDQHFKRRLLSHLTHCLNGVSTTENGGVIVPGRSPAEPVDDSPPLPPLAPKQGPVMSGGMAPSAQATSALFAATGLQLLPTRLPNGDLALVLPAQQRTTSPAAFRTQPPPPSTTPSSSCSSSQPDSPGSPPPLLAVPAPSFHPSRTASTASCSSTASSSASMSPVAFDGPAAFALTVPRPSPGRVQAVKPVAVVAGSPVAQPVPRMGEVITCTRPLSPPLQKPLSLVMKRCPAQEEMREEDGGPWRPW